MRGQLKQDTPQPAGGAQRINRFQKQFERASHFFEPKDVGNPHVGLTGKAEADGRGLNPVFESSCRGQAPERIVDLYAVEPASIVLKKLLVRHAGWIEARLPAWIRKSRSARIELRHRSRLQSTTVFYELVSRFLHWALRRPSSTGIFSDYFGTPSFHRADFSCCHPGSHRR